jgi:small subunit ribosomal protein S18
MKIQLYCRTPLDSFDLSADILDYKDYILLNRFLSEQGRILSKRVTKLTSKEQRYMSKSVKAARILAMLHFMHKIAHLNYQSIGTHTTQ